MRRRFIMYAAVVFIVSAVIIALSLQYGPQRQRDNALSAPTTTSITMTDTTHSSFILSSPAFAEGASIPSAYTCDDMSEHSPELAIIGVPDGTQSLVLIMQDPDIPQTAKDRLGTDAFYHWVLFNIPPTTTLIPEGGSAGVAGVNSAGEDAYTGPCPPPQYEPSEHRYIFTLYALDAMLDLPQGADKAAVLAAMEGHIIAQTQLVGRYKRQ